jgi:murein DD-endopeptidase MepM/ murein hydrolase activator NlpD
MAPPHRRSHSQSKPFAASLFAGFVVMGALQTSCLYRKQETAELILRGSIAESSEVVELDPVFLSRQKKAESQFFGFNDDSSNLAEDTVSDASEILTENSEVIAQEDVDMPSNNSVLSMQDNYASPSVQFLWPLPSKTVTSPFGPRNGRLHAGIDIRGGKGEPIYAAAAGQVLTSKRKKAYGNVVIVGHDYDRQTLYAHMTKMAVREGQYVRAGQVVGYVGRTGRATGYHLHFETRVNGGSPRNPMSFLKNARTATLWNLPGMPKQY